MASKTSIRLFYLIGFCLSLIALISAIYFQITDHLQPCPLCVLQRIFFLLISILSVIIIIHAPQTKKANIIYSFFLIVFCVLGGYFAIKQVYLEIYPPNHSTSCGVGIGYLFNHMAFRDYLYLFFNGSGDCSSVTWQFLGLTMATWSAIIFTVLTILYFINTMYHIINSKMI